MNQDQAAGLRDMMAARTERLWFARRIVQARIAGESAAESIQFSNAAVRGHDLRKLARDIASIEEDGRDNG